MRKLLLILFFFVAFGAYAQSELKFYYDLNCSSYYNVPKNEPFQVRRLVRREFLLLLLNHNK